MYKRILNLSAIVAKKSLLLLGPRQTGKTSLVLSSFPDAAYYNLAAADTFRDLSARPEIIRERLSESISTIIIDEAQLLPEIFDEAQVILDRNPSLRIILTGSSARKLKRGGINLLPGRVWKRDLFPLVSIEVPEASIETRITQGSLPGIINNQDYKAELRNYVGLYLTEEIRAEGAVRAIGDFSRFLTVAALTNAEQLNYSNVSSDTGVSINTVRSYFQILEDTLLGFQLPSFRKTRSRKAVAIPKFYFFDVGVVNAILDRFELSPQTKSFGNALEHLIFLEILAARSYLESSVDLSYWRTHSQIEVDFLIGDCVAIEVKAKERVVPRDEKGILALNEDVKLRRKIIVAREKFPRRTTSGVEILPVNEFFSLLWSGELFK